MTLLADTSIWVDYLRSGADGPAGALDRFIAGREVVLCGPVLAEILAGTREPDRSELWQILRSMPWSDLRRGHWRIVGEVAADLRTRGKTAPLTDIVIAVAAVSADAALWTRDDDFRSIQTVLPALELFEP